MNIFKNKLFNKPKSNVILPKGETIESMKEEARALMARLRKGEDLKEGPFLKATYSDGSTKEFTRGQWAHFGENILTNLRNIKIERI